MSDPLSRLATGIPIIGGMFDDSQDKAMEQLKQNQALYNGLNVPQFQHYTPEDYKYAGDYKPQDYQGQQIQEDPNIRNSQMGVLSRLAGLGQTGLSDVDNQGFQRARELGDQEAHSGNAAAIQNAQARGVGGSGMEFAMREMANQAGAGRAQDAGLQQAGDSARMRAMYEQAYGNALGGQRAQDFSANSANTDIVNRFNQMNTQGHNQAQQYNLQNQQQIGNMNTQGHNQAQQYNNDLQQRQYGDQLQKVQGQSGANNTMASGYAAENAANTAGRNQNTQMGVDAAMMAAGKPPTKNLDGTSV